MGLFSLLCLLVVPLVSLASCRSVVIAVLSLLSSPSPRWSHPRPLIGVVPVPSPLFCPVLPLAPSFSSCNPCHEQLLAAVVGGAVLVVVVVVPVPVFIPLLLSSLSGPVIPHFHVPVAIIPCGTISLSPSPSLSCPVVGGVSALPRFAE